MSIFFFFFSFFFFFFSFDFFFPFVLCIFIMKYNSFAIGIKFSRKRRKKWAECKSISCMNQSKLRERIINL